MIDLFIEQNAALFIKAHSEHIRENSPYRLDYSWDSIHIIDYIFQDSMSKQQSKEEIAEKILGLSCYLGICIYNVWSHIFEDSSVHFIYSEVNGSHAILKVQGGLYVVEGEISIDFFDVVLSAMQMRADKIEYVRGSYIPLGLEQYRFCYISHGILMGLSPFIKGTWEKVAEESLSLYLHKTINHVGLTALTNLKMRYPTKDRIIQESFFNPHLLLPPAGYTDTYVASRPTFHLAKKIAEYNLSKAEILEFGSILLESPSILQAVCGYVLLCSHDDEGIFLDILPEFAIHFPILAGQLKPAFDIYQEEVHKEENWPTLSKNNKYPEAVRRIKKEISVGINPLFFISEFDIIRDSVFRPYFESIDSYLIKEAFSLGNSLLTLDDCPPSVKIQHAWLALECNAPHVSEQIIKSLSQTSLSEDEKTMLLFLKIIIDPQVIDIEFASLPSILNSTCISQLHKKQLALICLGYIHKSIYKDMLLSLLSAHTACLSIPLVQAMKKYVPELEIPKKLRKAYWSKYYLLENNQT